jgi:hypothetical protein
VKTFDFAHLPSADSPARVGIALVGVQSPKHEFYLFFVLRVGFPLRFVFAIFLNSLSLIELAICFDAPLSDDFDFLPRFAASAAPAAICCFFDFAGIQKISRLTSTSVL